MTQSTTFLQPGVSTLTMRAIVLVLVVTAHLAVLSVWSKQPHEHTATTHEISLSIAMAAQSPLPIMHQAAKTAAAALPQPEPAQVAEPSTPAAEGQAKAAETAIESPAAPAIADTEPDYKASYLNNPPPAYPMVARRNGLQGRVLLNVEVLADGICGQINIHKSSGYAMLDNAALQTVRTWRFMPARQAGRAVDKWFMIPVQFSLKDNAA